MPLNLTWKDTEGRFSNGESLFVNGYKMGSFFWHSVKRGEPAVYRINTLLPVFKPTVTDYSSEKEARAALEAFTRRWFERFQ